MSVWVSMNRTGSVFVRLCSCPLQELAASVPLLGNHTGSSSLPLTADLQIKIFFMCFPTASPFHHDHEKRNPIAVNACIHWHMQWQLLCSGVKVCAHRTNYCIYFHTQEDRNMCINIFMCLQLTFVCNITVEGTLGLLTQNTKLMYACLRFVPPLHLSH
jgi:hypothetical protein